MNLQNVTLQMPSVSDGESSVLENEGKHSRSQRRGVGEVCDGAACGKDHHCHAHRPCMPGFFLKIRAAPCKIDVIELDTVCDHDTKR